MHSDSTYRQVLYEIRDDPDLSFPEKLTRYLTTACEYLQVENGHLKRVDRDRGEHYVIASAGDAVDLVTVGDVHDHATTFCRRTLELTVPLAITHAEEEGWATDPAYPTHGLECYLGTTVSVNGETFGTLCFVSRTPRSGDFSAAERAYVELLASLIGTELASKGYHQRLVGHDKLLAVQNRVLRHNLSNDMNIVEGYAGMLADRLEGEDKRLAERIGATAQRMVALGKKARRLETLVRDESVPGVVNMTPIVESVVEDLREQAPAAEITVRLPNRLYCVASAQVRVALEELGENALTHAGPTPTVEISAHLSEEGDWAVITIEDDGPGLSPLEEQVLMGQEETQLSHGQGLGLWLVYWVVMYSGGTVEVETADGTRVSMYLHAVAHPEDAQWAQRLFLGMLALW